MIGYYNILYILEDVIGYLLRTQIKSEWNIRLLHSLLRNVSL